MTNRRYYERVNLDKSACPFCIAGFNFTLSSHHGLCATTTSGHLGLVLAVDLVKQCPKDENGANCSHWFDFVPKHNRRQANTKHLSCRHDNSKHNWTKLW